MAVATGAAAAVRHHLDNPGGAGNRRGEVPYALRRHRAPWCTHQISREARDDLRRELRVALVPREGVLLEDGLLIVFKEVDADSLKPRGECPGVANVFRQGGRLWGSGASRYS